MVFSRRITSFVCTNVIAACVSPIAIWSWPVAAQPAPGPEEREQLVEYAQCIRENGYPDFPDPTGNGLRVLIKPGSAGQFQAAQLACRDKLPSGLAAADQTPSPERMETLLAFAACMRSAGIQDFPDPSPAGTFVIRGLRLDPSSPQMQSAMESCRSSTRVGPIRIGG